MEKYGIILTSGAMDWQIYQQTDGFADIPIRGEYYAPQGFPYIQPQVRILEEASNRPVIPWENMAFTRKDALTGTFEHTVRQLPAGGLYRLETRIQLDPSEDEWGARGDMVHHIGVGDLYIITGQSNAAGFGRDAACDAPEPGVHLYRQSGRWDMASHPFADSTGSRYPANTDIVNPGTCPYLSFAKLLKHQLGYPIGLVPASRGASCISSWLPSLDGPLYREMENYIRDIGGKFKGFLWYQGCSDASDEETARKYQSRFAEFVQSVRQEYGSEIPILTVQLNKAYDYGSPVNNDRFWNILRETQRQAARTMPNVYMAPAYDLCTGDDIHNTSASNVLLGERLARLALEAVYGLQSHHFLGKAPDLETIRAEDEKTAVLTFSNCFHLRYIHEYPDAFLIQAEDKDGRVPLKDYESAGNDGIRMIFARAFDPATVRFSCADGILPTPCVGLTDTRSYLPPIAFWDQKLS